jgi:hypothetical protein
MGKSLKAELKTAATSGTGPNTDEVNLTDPVTGNPNFIGNYHKGLPHNAFGEVVSAAYQTLLTAVTSRNSTDFNAITMGLGAFGAKLTSPQAGLAGDTEGPAPSTLAMRTPPTLDSAEEAGEAAELYWMALLRDVPFTDFAINAQIQQAAADLTNLSDFRGPKVGTQVTPGTIFRGFAPGDLIGPYLSQYLLVDVPYGSLKIEQTQQTVVANVDYLTQFDNWLAIQNGHAALLSDQFDSTRRYIRNMRDLGQYVHVDALYEAYLNACLILLAHGAPLDKGNPYFHDTVLNPCSKNQKGFATFGGPHLLALVCEVSTRALKAVWYQKWIVNRRLRPEAYAGLVHLNLAGHNGVVKNYPLHSDILNSEATQSCFSRYGSYLLPMAFPEGCPTHPSYGAGHASVAGACVTVLKAWFDQDAPLPFAPVVPNVDGTALISYTGADKDQLTVGGELNKVAANIAIGRNMAGVHWRSDYTESLKLGEEIAIEILRQQSANHNYNERLAGGGDPSFTLTKFDGATVRIENGVVI